MRQAMLRFTLTALALLCFVWPRPSSAQEERSLEETLRLLSGDAATQYLAPISSASGANVNSGWFHRSPAAERLGFHFEAGLVMMGSFYPEDADHFDVSGTFRFSTSEANALVDLFEESEDLTLPGPIRAALVDELIAELNTVGISGATVVGAADDSLTISYAGGTYTIGGMPYEVPSADLTLPVAGYGDLASINLMPLAVPQISLGTVWGTQFTLRYLPSVELDQDLGAFTYTGFGIQHNPMVWMKWKLPVDVSAGFFTQQLEIGDLFVCKSTAFGLTASKTLGWRFLNLTPYAGFMLEDATMEVDYNFEVETPAGLVSEPIHLELESENSSRLTLGLNARLGIVNWNLDYSLAAYPAISTGVNLAF